MHHSFQRVAPGCNARQNITIITITKQGQFQNKPSRSTKSFSYSQTSSHMIEYVPLTYSIMCPWQFFFGPVLTSTLISTTKFALHMSYLPLEATSIIWTMHFLLFYVLLIHHNGGIYILQRFILSKWQWNCLHCCNEIFASVYILNWAGSSITHRELNWSHHTSFLPPISRNFWISFLLRSRLACCRIAVCSLRERDLAIRGKHVSVNWVLPILWLDWLMWLSSRSLV